MPFVPLHEVFPDLAEQETRTFTILEDGELPAANYALVELFCDEPGCDCRRVIFSVMSSQTGRTMAHIGYGWESLSFYKQWLSFDDPQMVKDMKDPALNPLSPQSEIAPAVLNIVITVVIQDERYVERLETHYKLFRNTLGGKKNVSCLQRPKKSRIKRSGKRKSAWRK